VETIDEIPNESQSNEPTSSILDEEVLFDAENVRVPINSYSIYDIVFPNPDNPDVGLYKSNDTKSKISAASFEWKTKNGVEIQKLSSTTSIITGDFLKIENIGKYSMKYKSIMQSVLDITKESEVHIGDKRTPVDLGQKIMIYHDRVRMSGVLLFQEMLKVNGIIDEFSEPIGNTLCTLCAGTLDNHSAYIKKNNLVSHQYKPSRFVIAYSDIDKNIMETSIAKFNSPENAHGLNYKILIGSKTIRQGYEMKDVQNLFIATLPVNIPIMIQVFGRCIRKNSHINLPIVQRNVKIRIFVNTLSADDSFEIQRYAEKLSDYMIIQKIEKEMNSHAIDSNLHRKIIMPKELKEQYDNNSVGIGNLYFEPAVNLDNRTITLSTYTAYKYFNEEIKYITYMIKRFFMKQTVWTYDDLFKAITSNKHNIHIELNWELFSENNFIIALNSLVTTNIVTEENQITEQFIIEKLMDPNDVYVYIDKLRYKIYHIAEYYILFPLTKENKPIKDIDAFDRPQKIIKGISIDIEQWLKETKSSYNFEVYKNILMEKFENNMDLINMFDGYNIDFHVNLLTEIIKWMFKNHQDFNKLIRSKDKIAVFYKGIIEIYDNFTMLIYNNEVLKYKDISNKLTDVNQLKSKVPFVVGFLDKRSVRIYDGYQWIETSKISMNKLTHFRENEDVIGYFEQSADNTMKFKLRNSINKIRKNVRGDVRLIEKGMVCTTKQKSELLKIIRILNITYPREHKKIRGLCTIIRDKLIKMEISYRQKDSKDKTVYMWWEQQSEFDELLAATTIVSMQ
jgi:hypothetical protein